MQLPELLEPRQVKPIIKINGVARPWQLSLATALEQLRQGELTSVQWVRACLQRIDELDGTVEAWAWLDAGRAQRGAAAADLRFRNGQTGMLPLNGVPIGVKDIIFTRELPTEMGSPIFAGHHPAEDAAVVQRLQAAGAVVMGKTSTTEFAFMHASKTRNPWNPAHTPGGSSAGSAAAVAAGFVPAAIGTQTNGSVIRPAAFCGVVGFKPTMGALPYSGISMFSPTLDQLGVFARGVADAALLAAPLADPAYGITAQTTPRRAAPHFAMLMEYPWVKPTGEQRAMLIACAGALRNAGAHVTDVVLPAEFADAQRVHRTIMLFEAVSELGALQDRERERMSAKLNAGMDAGRVIGEADYHRALELRDQMIARLPVLFEGCDALLSPPATGGAPNGISDTGDPSFCTFWSLMAAPAITLPVGWNRSGVPLGLQMTALPRGDAALLDIAAWSEQQLFPAYAAGAQNRRAAGRGRDGAA
jgi:Asp-tRNA(Asn)/Glu-tRNA(Gln) amidotransferase A subunit family amidase